MPVLSTMAALLHCGTTVPSSPSEENLAWPGWLDIEDIVKEHPRPLRAQMTGAQYAASLEPEERQWVHIQPWLQSKGYMLRPRFRVGWMPSWSNGTSSTPMQHCEDSIRHTVRYCYISPRLTSRAERSCSLHLSVQKPARSVVMDAVRISDGHSVLLKRFDLPANGRTELEINTLLSSEPLKSNPRNPALPLLDVIYAPDQCFMVFPFVQYLYSMELDTIGEGLDLVEQTLEVRSSPSLL